MSDNLSLREFLIEMMGSWEGAGHEFRRLRNDADAEVCVELAHSCREWAEKVKQLPHLFAEIQRLEKEIGMTPDGWLLTPPKSGK